MAHDIFSDDYHAVRKILENGTFAGALQKPMDDINRILGARAPQESHYQKLEFLRMITLKFKEVERMLEGAGMEPAGTTAPNDTQAKLLAAIKFLRHLYLVSVKGSQVVWVHSTPKDFATFTYDEVYDAKGSVAGIKSVLGKTEERFTETQKERIGEAIQWGPSWCQKAGIVLASPKTPANKALIDRWFKPADSDFDKVVAKLKDGFDKIVALLNDNNVIITDKPQDRTNPRKDLVEAYVKKFPDRAEIREVPRTIYVEKAMFENYEISVLHDMKKNWTRILVHECTHLEANTDDKGGYAYRGIKPQDRVTPARAANNADSWAFFAADCGGALVENEINRALNGTGGGVKKQPHNWNG